MVQPLMIVVSGSFGHFQASKSGVHKGGLSRPLVKSGFVATRISVKTLNFPSNSAILESCYILLLLFLAHYFEDEQSKQYKYSHYFFIDQPSKI